MSDSLPVGTHNLEDHPLEHYQMHVFEGKVAIVWKTGKATAVCSDVVWEGMGPNSFTLHNPKSWLSYFDASMDATRRLIEDAR